MKKIVCNRTILSLVTFVMLVSVSVTEAQQAIFLVRHAEQSAETDDPELTEAGRKRAKALASVLKDVGITVIYTTERKRAIQTAEPTEKLLNVASKRLALRDLDGLVERLRNQHTQDRILVVSHHLALPRLLKALGHPAEIAIALHEYDNLFVLVPKTEGGPMLLRLRY
jgi:2,3-bisphosphoglycerate-dependent phosphoglycerate mutase